MSIFNHCKFCSKSGLFLKLDSNDLCDECSKKFINLKKSKADLIYKIKNNHYNMSENINNLKSILKELILFYKKGINIEPNPNIDLNELIKKEEGFMIINKIQINIDTINSKYSSVTSINDSINLIKSLLPKVKQLESENIKISTLNAIDIEFFIEKAEKKLSRKEKYENKKIQDRFNYIAFDLETTGLNPSTNEIIEIGAVKISHGEIIDTFQSLIKPSKKISSKITSINHITNDMVKNEKKIEAVLPEFINFIDRFPLIAHNVDFDYSFLKEAYNKIYGKNFGRKHICTMKLYKKYYKEYYGENPYSCKLGNCVSDLLSSQDTDEYYTGAHRALTDAKMVYKLYEVLSNKV